jgi:hypothetical protein
MAGNATAPRGRITLDAIRPYDVLGLIASFDGRPNIWASVCTVFNHQTVQQAAYKALQAAYERYPLLKAVADAKFKELMKALGHPPSVAQLVQAVYYTVTEDGADELSGEPRYIPLPHAPLGRLHPKWLLKVAPALDIQSILKVSPEKIVGSPKLFPILRALLL